MRTRNSKKIKEREGMDGAYDKSIHQHLSEMMIQDERDNCKFVNCLFHATSLQAQQCTERHPILGEYSETREQDVLVFQRPISEEQCASEPVRGVFWYYYRDCCYKLQENAWWIAARNNNLEALQLMFQIPYLATYMKDHPILTHIRALQYSDESLAVLGLLCDPERRILPDLTYCKYVNWQAVEYASMRKSISLCLNDVRYTVRHNAYNTLLNPDTSYDEMHHVLALSRDAVAFGNIIDGSYFPLWNAVEGQEMKKNYLRVNGLLPPVHMARYLNPARTAMNFTGASWKDTQYNKVYEFGYRSAAIALDANDTDVLQLLRQAHGDHSLDSWRRCVDVYRFLRSPDSKQRLVDVSGYSHAELAHHHTNKSCTTSVRHITAPIGVVGSFNVHEAVRDQLPQESYSRQYYLFFKKDSVFYAANVTAVEREGRDFVKSILDEAVLDLDSGIRVILTRLATKTALREMVQAFSTKHGIMLLTE